MRGLTRSVKIVGILWGLGLVWQLPLPAAGAEFGDSFGLENRTAGKPLNGLALESGSQSWEATPNLVLGAAAGSVIVTDAHGFAGRVALPVAIQVVKVAADLRAVPAAGSSWVALGIGSPVLGCPPWGGGFFLSIDSGGFYHLSGDNDPKDYESKSIIPLQSGRVPQFDPDSSAPTRIELEYDRVHGTLAARINGTEVATGFDLVGKGVKVNPAFAGFSGYGQKNGTPTVSAFSVVVSP